MEPRIQYAKTGDGVSIAYWTLGDGVPLVVPPLLTASHLQIEWEQESRRGFYMQLAERARVVRYDGRGMGMSERRPMDFSPEAACLDMEAVVDRLGLERFAIFGMTLMGDAAFAFAATRPDRVSRLVHREVISHWTTTDVGRRVSVIAPLMEQDWELYTEILARLIGGWNSPGAGGFAEHIRASHTPASLQAATSTLMNRSFQVYLGAITAPALVMHALGDDAETATARRLASGIAHATVLGIPGLTARPYPNAPGVLALLDFITAEAGEGTSLQIDVNAVRTILFTDLVGHTAMMDRLGDDAGRAVLREHERVTREVLKEYGGIEVKTIGDSFMASFPSVTKAVECALALQRRFAERNAAAGEALHVRVGLNAGEPIADEGDLFGSSVIAASRITSQAKGGEILVSDVVRQLAAGKGFLFSDRGETVLRGFEEPVRLYEVSWREGGA